MSNRRSLPDPLTPEQQQAFQDEFQALVTKYGYDAGLAVLDAQIPALLPGGPHEVGFIVLDSKHNPLMDAPAPAEELSPEEEDAYYAGVLANNHGGASIAHMTFAMVIVSELRVFLSVNQQAQNGPSVMHSIRCGCPACLAYVESQNAN